MYKVKLTGPLTELGQQTNCPNRRRDKVQPFNPLKSSWLFLTLDSVVLSGWNTYTMINTQSATEQRMWC